MSRYIDADLLMKELGITDPDCEKCEWGCKGFPSCSRDGDFVDACDAICEAPTADVRENVHAHWEDWSFLGWDMETHWLRRCSNCLCEREDDNEEKDTPFCPNCGARMDEVTE